jgi:pimeloyl-ACP methyl ester carboxylesterase
MAALIGIMALTHLPPVGPNSIGTSAGFSSADVTASDLVGIWTGKLRVGTASLRIVFHVKSEPTGVVVTLDSPDQNVKGLACAQPEIKGSQVIFAILSTPAKFVGSLTEDRTRISGNWVQGASILPLDLKRVESVEGLNRPQTPRPPFPYAATDVTFENSEAKVILAGTLTLPSGPGPFPAVVLISGSGPQDRDETIFEHRPFAVLADYLTRRGIAVLRYDDRGVAKSTGDRSSSTTMDFAADAEAGLEFLRTRPEIDPKRVGLLGHSEGGIIAPIVAARNSNVAFIVLMAGTGVPGAEIVLRQQALIARAGGVSEAEIKDLTRDSLRYQRALRGKSEAERKKNIDAYLSEAWKKMAPGVKATFGTEEEFKKSSMPAMVNPWSVEFFTLDPREYLKKVKVPVLAINGEKDLQVDPKQNLPEIEKALKAGGNKQVTVRTLTGLNHLFQFAETGSPSEYAQIEETLSPSFLLEVTNWLTAILAKREK